MIPLLKVKLVQFPPNVTGTGNLSPGGEFRDVGDSRDSSDECDKCDSCDECDSSA